MEFFFKDFFRRYWHYFLIFLLCFCGFVLYLAIAGSDGKLHMYFLNVGQGDSVLFITPDGKEVLIDGGPGNKVIEELGEILPFQDKTIEMLVLTHPDKDHMEGLVEVLKRFDVKKVMLTGVLKQDALYEEFLREVEDVEVIVADENSDFNYSGVSFDVLYPFQQIAGEEFENLNDTSIALMVAYKGKRVLLTGDAEKKEENELIASGTDLRADTFKAGHHGSKSSSSFEFLQKISPKIVVIQVGAANKYGHPHAETLKNIERAGVEEIYRTDIDGRVEFAW